MNSFKDYLDKFGEVGFVKEIIHSIIYADGLPSVHSQEIVLFESGEIGQVFTLHDKYFEIIFFSTSIPRVGTRIVRTGNTLQIPVGQYLLGKTIDPLARSLTGEQISVPKNVESRPIYNNPLGIDTRARIHRFFETGVKAVDMLLPIGYGQRELVMGDRKTGKTDFLLKAITTQAKQGVVCIYVAIGKKMLDVKKIQEFFTTSKLINQVCIVATGSNDPSSLIYIAPFTGMAIAESIRDQGKDVLVVFDDLTTHAKVYREIALLAKRFPGRNSYPADIFFIHAQLLERAGNFKVKDGQAAITCLPIVEAAQGDMLGYIQTNLMSITDGHLFFDSDLFAKGRRPAVNPFLSVTRVGHQTQSQVMREINRELVSFLTLYEKTQSFIHFGAEMSASVANTLATGDRIVAFFNQDPAQSIPTLLQLFLFCILWAGAWQKSTLDVMKKDMTKISERYFKDDAIRKHVDTIITEATSFNTLLGTIGKNLTTYVSYAK